MFWTRKHNYISIILQHLFLFHLFSNKSLLTHIILVLFRFKTKEVENFLSEQWFILKLHFTPPFQIFKLWKIEMSIYNNINYKKKILQREVWVKNLAYYSFNFSKSITQQQYYYCNRKNKQTFSIAEKFHTITFRFYVFLNFRNIGMLKQ